MAPYNGLPASPRATEPKRPTVEIRVDHDRAAASYAATRAAIDEAQDAIACIPHALPTTGAALEKFVAAHGRVAALKELATAVHAHVQKFAAELSNAELWERETPLRARVAAEQAARTAKIREEAEQKRAGAAQRQAQWAGHSPHAPVEVTHRTHNFDRP